MLNYYKSFIRLFFMDEMNVPAFQYNSASVDMVYTKTKWNGDKC
jgi:hypothetical protein